MLNKIQLPDEIKKNTVTNGNSISLIKKLPSQYAHLILSDIPYGIGAEDWDVLHNNSNNAYLGSSPAQKNAGAIFKKRGKPINGWSEADKKIPLEYQQWCEEWATEWFRVLKPGASAIIFAGRRFSHRCICAMEDAGFHGRGGARLRDRRAGRGHASAVGQVQHHASRRGQAAQHVSSQRVAVSETPGHPSRCPRWRR